MIGEGFGGMRMERLRQLKRKGERLGDEWRPQGTQFRSSQPHIHHSCIHLHGRIARARRWSSVFTATLHSRNTTYMYAVRPLRPKRAPFFQSLQFPSLSLGLYTISWVSGITHSLASLAAAAAASCKSINSAQTVVDLHCVQTKTPTHIFFYISTNYFWI